MFFRCIWVAALLAALPAGAAETLLYATGIRMHYEDGAARVECNLYRVDPVTGTATLVAPVRIGGREPVAIVSLAIHPESGKTYGVTAGLAPTIPRSLVSIDPASGDVELIGALGEVASDLAFAGDGTLYAWLPERNRLARVDLTTGRASPLEPSGISGVMGGGMAIDEHDIAYVAATGATGTLDTVDIHTGHGTTGPTLEGAPYLSAITNLTFSPAGKLYAVNSNMGAPANTALVSIDPHNGQVHEIGRLPTDAHALIFATSQDAMDLRQKALLVAGAAALVLIGLVFVLSRRRR